MRSIMEETNIIGYIFPALGFALVVLAAWLAYKKKMFKESCERAPGTVIEMIRSSSGSGQAPVIEYMAYGQKYTYRSSLYTSPPFYKVGEEVEVFYKSEDPQKAVISGFMEQWFLPLLLGFIGTVFVIVGVVMSISNE